MSHRHRRVSFLFGVLAVISGCRYDVQLQGERDAAVDVFTTSEVGSDSTVENDAPDAPPQTCASGIALIGAREAPGERSATIASSSSADGRRYGILVPPAVRDDGASTTRLIIVNDEGAILHTRELALLDGAGEASESATLHTLPAGEGFLLLMERAIVLLDVEGATLSELPLTTPPLASAQRRAGFVDEGRFVFVSSDAGAPLVVFDRSGPSVGATAIETEGVAVILIHRGGVTLGIDDPTETIEYSPSLNGDVTFRSGWPPAPIARRLLGAYTAGGRRLWVTADGEEFRNDVSLVEVPDVGSPLTLTSATLIAPLELSQEDELLTVVDGPGGLAVIDFPRAAIDRLGYFTAPSIERAESGYLVLSLEAGALTLRCLP